MKRILKILLVVMMFIPALVFADVAGPQIQPYEVMVINEKGTDISDSVGKEHLDYGTVVKVLYKLSSTKIMIDYNGKQYEAVTSDFRVIKEEVEPKDIYDVQSFQKLEKEETKKFIVTSQNAPQLKKGPADAYGIAGKLAPGEYEYKYVSAFYIYVETEDTKGWLDTYEAGVLIPNDKEKLIVTEELKLSCGKVLPVNTIIDNYYMTALGSYGIIIDYLECPTELNTFKNKHVTQIVDDKKNSNNYYSALKEITIYTTPNKESEVLGAVKNGGEFYIAANYLDYDFDEIEGDPEDYNKDNKARFYIFYENIKGWADLGVLNLDYKQIEGDTSKEELEEEKETNKIDTKQIVIYSIIGGVCVALASIAIISLLNRKKKGE